MLRQNTRIRVLEVAAMIIVKPPLHTLHDNTVRWLAGIVGELQREVTRLENENAGLRDQLRDARQEQRKERALARAAGGGR